MKDNEITADPQSIELLDTSNDTVEYARSDAIAKTTLLQTSGVHGIYNIQQTRLHQRRVDRDTAQVFKTAGYPQLNRYSTLLST